MGIGSIKSDGAGRKDTDCEADEDLPMEGERMGTRR